MLTIDLFEDHNNEPVFIQALRDFLPVALRVLNLKQVPKIVLKKELHNTNVPTFGRFTNDEKVVYCVINNRHPNDILRTLAHELAHYGQGQEHELSSGSWHTGSPVENDAHVKAGIIMRHFNTEYPKYLKAAPIVLPDHAIKEDQDNCDAKNAVPELKAALTKRKTELKNADAKVAYDKIDKIMTRIAQTYNISGQELHDLWTERYGEIPDTWVLDESKENKPVTIHTNPYYRGATIGAGVKEQLPITKMPIEDLQMWENDKTLRTKKVRDWVKNTLIPKLQDKGRLMPLIVWNRKGKHFVIDGNHRFLAYKAAGFKGPVPVRVVPQEMIAINNKVLAPVDEAVTPPQHTEIIRHPVGDWIVYLDNHSMMRAMTRGIGPRLASNLITVVAMIPNLENKVPVGGDFWIQDTKTNSSFYFKRLDVPGEPNAVRCETGVQDVPRASKQTPVFTVNAYTGPEKPEHIKAMKNAKHISRFVGGNTMAANIARNVQTAPWTGDAEKEVIKNPTTQDSKRYDRAFNQAQQLKKKGEIDENFADGKGPGRPGDSQRHGIPKGATMAQLEKASHSAGRKGQLARWQINMRNGKKK